jgi:hypothetical protein
MAANLLLRDIVIDLLARTNLYLLAARIICCEGYFRAVLV